MGNAGSRTRPGHSSRDCQKRFKAQLWQYGTSAETSGTATTVANTRRDSRPSCNRHEELLWAKRFGTAPRHCQTKREVGEEREVGLGGGGRERKDKSIGLERRERQRRRVGKKKKGNWLVERKKGKDGRR